MFSASKIRVLGAIIAWMPIVLMGAGKGMPAPSGSFFSESVMLAPLLPEQRLTTHGRIYVENLDGMIASLKTAIESRQPASGSALLRLKLARNLYHRFRIVGRLSDLVYARTMAEQITLDQPGNAQAWLLLGRMQAAFHDFNPAIESLQRAEQGQADQQGCAALRYEIEHAMGDGYLRPQVENPPAPDTLAEFVQQANEAINDGDLGWADELLTVAQFRIRDSNPYPLAWLHVQHGIAFLRFGDPARARVFFRAAHARLPAYYLATEHLAETELLLGEGEAAAVLYQAVYLQTGNPEFLAGLAAAQKLLKLDQAVDTLRQAFEEYQKLLERYPAMYGQHAAGFYLNHGRAKEALALAELNLGLRNDLQSIILFADAAFDAGNRDIACRKLKLGVNSGARPPELMDLQSRLGPACKGVIAARNT